MDRKILAVDIPVGRSPAEVRAWWTDLPDEYNAADPSERPHRILTTKRLPNGKQLATFWKDGSGKEIRIDEKLTMGVDGSWEFDLVHPAGYEIHQHWRAVDVHGKTRLEVRATVTPTTEQAAREIGAQLAWMEELWRSSARICERDAPKVPPKRNTVA